MTAGNLGSRPGIADGGARFDPAGARRNRQRVIAAAVLALAAGCSTVGLPWQNVRGCVTPDSAASPVSDGATVLVALGDFGDGSTGRNVDVAEALRRYLEERSLRPEAFVLLGDNFYPNGLIGARTACVPFAGPPDEAIAAQLRAVVTPFAFLRDHADVWALPGNHDHRCPRLGSLANQRTIDRWLPPADRWGDRWRVAEGPPRAIVDHPRVQVIALDTTPMIRDGATLREHGAALESLLDDGRSRWRLVAGHHPLYANGHHDGAWFSGTFAKLVYYPAHVLFFPPVLYGGQANYEWGYRRYRRDLEAIFARSRVDVFLGGHEHALELLRPAAAGQPLTLISGAAARCGKIMRRGNTLIGASKSGFAVLFVSDDSLTIEIVGTTGCDRRNACARPRTPGEWHVLSAVRLDRRGVFEARGCGAAPSPAAS